MLGLRDLVLIAQTPSSLQNQQNQPISSDHHPNHPLPSSSALSVGLGIFPLITTTTHSHHQNQNQNNDTNIHQDSNFWNLKMCQPQQVMMMNSTRKRVEEKEDEKIKTLAREENINGDGEFKVCLDCGNRAKKDCSFQRCRTCCKGRGFDCRTHVKSTWVPASLRRYRKAEGGGDSGGVSSGTKRQRILVSSSHNAAATSRSSNASFKQSLPRYVRAPAVFKCHRVSAIGNGEDELAYLATVNISGHVFKGFLYDHGIDAKNETMPCVSELQLGSNGSGKSYKECSSSAIEVPTSAYPASAC
ncbi:hypothetical protein TSUD_365380 [Trifolium subterraneum]|uniref:Uncharacterized protein n=1 Tax=Trifolium subterraneum TaxID=3900 RepID=A0A2Z6P5C7_TRISU|nr:hypothetical protein TSUD_365380 [Trifolium subterraneum]